MPNTLTEPDMDEMLGRPGYKHYLQLVQYQSQDVWSDAEVSFINEVRWLYGLASKRTAGAVTQPGSYVFNGGHVELRDNGLYYSEWLDRLETKALKGGDRTESSSHVTDWKQWEIVLPCLGCILFGTRGGHTWFQNEAHSMTTTTTQQILHGTDFVAHASSGFKQVGALGYSIHSEKKGTQLVIGPDVNMKSKLD